MSRRIVLKKEVYTYAELEQMWGEGKFDTHIQLSTGKDLQRGYVWDQNKIEEFISNLLSGDTFPPLIFYVPYAEDTDCVLSYKVVDGKQRLTTLCVAALPYKDEIADREFDVHVFRDTLDERGVPSLTESDLQDWFQLYQ